jgi:hypothetical protein
MDNSEVLKPYGQVGGRSVEIAGINKAIPYGRVPLE